MIRFSRMPNEQKRFIQTRGQAIVVVFSALLLVGSRFWRTILHQRAESGWIYPFNSWLPNWTALLANIFTYALFAAFFAGVVTQWRGTERVIAAILIAEVLVSPARQYLPPAAAEAVVWIQAFAELVMLFGAVHLYLSISESKSNTLV
jgi:hypothetical protein